VVAKALNRFETYTKFRDFKAFHIEQAKSFKSSLSDQTSVRTNDRLSKATLYATLTALKRFFIWLAGQPGYKFKISYSDAEYFNLSAKETRIAKAHRDARVPTLEQIRHVIRTMPTTTEIERRDRALVAFTVMTGARDGAIASLKSARERSDDVFQLRRCCQSPTGRNHSGARIPHRRIMLCPVFGPDRMLWRCCPRISRDDRRCGKTSWLLDRATPSTELLEDDA
jgi:hypothetical protein